MGVTKDALPAVTFERAPVSALAPDRNSVRAWANGNLAALAYAFVASPL